MSTSRQARATVCVSGENHVSTESGHAAITGVAGDAIAAIDRFVPHVSTVPAIHGQLVGLHLREKVLESVQQSAAGTAKPHVVLFIHGGYSPSVVAYDLDYKDYSFMAALARAGFDAFAMTHTGYGASPKPLLDDPCNVDASMQPWIIPQVLKEPCLPRYPYKLVSSRTEWDEIETAVRFIRELRGVERISLVCWSTGAPRAAPASPCDVRVACTRDGRGKNACRTLR